MVERRNPPSARAVRVIRRRIQTPPPPSSDAWHTGPRRLINSDTEAIQRQQRMRRNDANNSPTPEIRPEVYYLEGAPNIRGTPIETPVSGPRDEFTPPPPLRVMRQSVRTRNPERRNTRVVEPIVVRRVYKNYPPSRLGAPDHHLVTDENHPPAPIRQNRKNPPLPPPPPSKQRQQSPPEFNNRRPTAKPFRSPPESDNRRPTAKPFRSPPESDNRRPTAKPFRSPPESDNRRHPMRPYQPPHEPDIRRPPVKHYQSPPEPDNGHPPLAKRPSIFYIRNREEYE